MALTYHILDVFTERPVGGITDGSGDGKILGKSSMGSQKNCRPETALGYKAAPFLSKNHHPEKISAPQEGPGFPVPGCEIGRMSDGAGVRRIQAAE